jgi:hypothetical protein
MKIAAAGFLRAPLAGVGWYKFAGCAFADRAGPQRRLLPNASCKSKWRQFAGDGHRSRGRRCLLRAQGRAVRSEPSPNCSHTNCGEGLTWFQSWHSPVGAKLTGSGLGGPSRCHSITKIEAACRSTKSHVKRFSMSAGAFVGASVSARFHPTQASQRLDSHFLRARCAIKRPRVDLDYLVQ